MSITVINWDFILEYKKLYARKYQNDVTINQFILKTPRLKTKSHSTGLKDSILLQDPW